MTMARNTHKRTDLVMRDLMTTAEPVVVDLRWERIVEKVMEFMDTTDPITWEPSVWSVFKEKWKQQQTTEQPSQEAEPDLDAARKRLTGDPSTSAP